VAARETSWRNIVNEHSEAIEPSLLLGLIGNLLYQNGAKAQASRQIRFAVRRKFPL
jgi:hypothetical protein